VRRSTHPSALIGSEDEAAVIRLEQPFLRSRAGVALTNPDRITT
jgi:hypothetical protein